MPAGLQAWDENGILIVDLTTRLGRVLGVINISATDAGTIYIPVGYGQLWVLPIGSYGTAPGGNYVPNITYSNDGLSFTYSPDTAHQGGAQSAIIYWGVR